MVAAGKTATLECRVMNIGDRTVSEMTFPNYKFDEMLFMLNINGIAYRKYHKDYQKWHQYK